MNKYYTPTIEEFHVGFEYEYLRLMDGESLWQKDTYGDRVKSVNTLKIAFGKGCRVKALDQKDIEECGFGTWSDSLGYWRCFKYASEEQYLCLKRISDIHTVIEIVNKDKEGKRFNLFQGDIKNKSELKRILKQIGYADV